MPANTTSLRYVEVTPTVDAGNQYSANDLISDTAAITRGAAAANQLCYLTGATIYDKSDNTAWQLKLAILKSNTSLGTINGAPNISDANVTEILAIIDIPAADWYDVGGSKMVHIDPAKLPIACIPASDTPNLYFGIINGDGTPTLAASALVCRFFFQDMIPTV